MARCDSGRVASQGRVGWPRGQNGQRDLRDGGRQVRKIRMSTGPKEDGGLRRDVF